MFDVDRILALPDQSIDYLQCGIAGRERAALEKRGFIRKDGIKAKDYMIRTIEKTAKNKAKAEKAIIKGDKPLTPNLTANTKGEIKEERLSNTKRKDLEFQIEKVFSKQIPSGEKIERTLVDGVSTLQYKNKKLISTQAEGAGESWRIVYLAPQAEQLVKTFLK